VIRYGALGDAVWMTPLLKQLKADGYHVVLNCTEYSAQVLKECPWIDEFIFQGKDVVPNEELKPYWDMISEGFAKVINLSGSVEDVLLVREGSDDANLGHAVRHAMCNKNYMDATMARGGYPEMTGCLPELHFTLLEEELGQMVRTMKDDKFIILWSLSGSAFHKLYPWSEYVAGSIERELPNAQIITVGDHLCQILEWQLPGTLNKCGKFTVRQSMIMTKFADLVIGPETGILNAAACYETPKIVFMSHSSVENLTKYWKNCHSVAALDCECQPCHKLIYTPSCPKDEISGAPKCCAGIKPETVFAMIKEEYEKWETKRKG
jgi:ADP-heptose:LPS heptosyltransferase